MKNLKKLAFAASAYFAPFAVAVAQIGGDDEVTGDNITTALNQINAVINVIIPFIVGIAVLIVIWGVFTYIAGAGDEEKRAQARQFVIWGVIGIFIMLSIWGLVSVLVNTFDVRRTPLRDDKFPTFDTEIEYEGPGGGIGGETTDDF